MRNTHLKCTHNIYIEHITFCIKNSRAHNTLTNQHPHYYIKPFNVLGAPSVPKQQQKWFLLSKIVGHFSGQFEFRLSPLVLSRDLLPPNAIEPSLSRYLTIAR